MTRTIQDTAAEGFLVLLQLFYQFLAGASAVIGLISTGLSIGLAPRELPFSERILVVSLTAVIGIVAVWFFVFVSRCLRRREWKGVLWLCVFHGLVFLAVVVSCCYQFRYWQDSGPGIKDYLVAASYAAIILIPPLAFLFPAVRAKFRQV